ncbi:MAG: S9 family peptidase [Sphingomonas sp. 28-66-16]|nr:MAG: S9 family peptidase [Sphingomonas sp. 28-66-16]
MRAHFIAAAVVAAVIFSASTAASADPVTPVHQYAALALSPQGDRIASVESGEGGHDRIVVRQAGSGKVITTIDPCARCSYAGLSFAPDGALALLARDREAGTVMLEIAGANAAPRLVATVRGIAQAPSFSPDGRRIALLVTIGAAKETGATQAGVRQIGEIGAKSDSQRLAVFDLAAPPVAADGVRPVSPDGRYIYEYDWTPDGNGFVVTSALGNGDANWWSATLDAVDAASGAVRTIARPATQLNFPRVSPDGRTVAYIGGLMSDFGSVGGDVWTVPVAGGTPVNITQGAKATATALDWTMQGLRAAVLRGDHAQIVSVSPETGFSAPLFGRRASFAAGDGRVAFSADGGQLATVVQDYTHAPAIYAGALAEPRQITHDNDRIKPIVTARSIGWHNDGFDVQGWLLAPIGADLASKAPMITIVHGGPAAASVPAFLDRGVMADLVEAGYYLFLPNPRGSYGQGEAFVQANKRDFGGGDLRDILAGIDAVEKLAPVDDSRLGLMGGSYGGFMAMWANTQTTRFKAIVSGAGLSNWISYYGTNGINQWMLPYFGKTLYEDYDAYRAPSAIYFMKRAKTPTFLYVGERDIEVPPTQSIEYWHALQELGVPTSLVIYAEEGHGIRAPANAADLRRRTVAWFDRYLGGK